MILKELLANTPVYQISGMRKADIVGLTVYPDQVDTGYLYIYFDIYTDLDYKQAVQTAIEKGAVAVCIGKEQEFLPYDITFIKTYNMRRFISAITKNFYSNPSQNMNLVGITGSHGKTTIGFMIKSILEWAGTPPIMIGASFYLMGDEHILCEDILNPLEYMRYLRQAIDSGINKGIIECPYTAIIEERLRHIWFDSIIYTDLYTYFQNQKSDYHFLEIRKALIDHLKFSHSPIIVNMDDYHAHQLESKNIIGYGLYGKYDISAYDISITSDGCHFMLRTSAGDEFIEIKTPGLHNVYNAMAAAAWGLSEGIKLDTIHKGIESMKNMQQEDNPSKIPEGKVNINILDNTASLEDIEDVYTGLDDGQPVATVLCVGSRGNNLAYKGLAHIINKYSRYCIITSDYSDRYNYMDTALSIAQNMGDVTIHHEVDRYKALQKAVSLIKKGGNILLITDSCKN